MNNNKILTKRQLLQQISLLVDNYVSNVLEKKPEYEFVVNNNSQENVNESNECQESGSVVTECVTNECQTSDLTSNDNEAESGDDNICMAFLTNGKRCSRERCPEGADPEICKFHNNKKFDGRLEKITRGGPIQKKMKRYKKPEKTSNATRTSNTTNTPNTTSNKLIINEEIEEVQEFRLFEDEDGHMIDQNGSIWDLETETIIGKKDIETKEKIFYKKL